VVALFTLIGTVEQEVHQGVELFLEGFEAVMEFTHKFQAKVFAEGVTSLEAVRVRDVLRVMVNHPQNLCQPLLKVGVSVPWDVCGIGEVHLLVYVTKPLSIWGTGSHRTLHGHTCVAYY